MNVAFAADMTGGEMLYLKPNSWDNKRNQSGVLPYSIGAYLISHAAKKTNFQIIVQAAAV